MTFKPLETLNASRIKKNIQINMTNLFLFHNGELQMCSCCRMTAKLGLELVLEASIVDKSMP